MKKKLYTILEFTKKMFLSLFLLVATGVSSAALKAQITTPVNTGPKNSFPAWSYMNGIQDYNYGSGNAYRLPNSTGGFTYVLASPRITLTSGSSSTTVTITFQVNTGILAKGASLGGMFNAQFYASNNSNTTADQVGWGGSSGLASGPLGINYASQSFTGGSNSNWNNVTIRFQLNSGNGNANLSTPSVSSPQYLFVALAAPNAGNSSALIRNVQISVNANGSVLPVVYQKKLSATVSQSGVQLSWATANEINNKGFQVQRSVDGGNTWSDLSFIVSKGRNGNSATPLDYSVPDNNPIQGTNLYRLVQMDYDGRTNTSGTVSIQYNGSIGEGMSVYPNPVKGNGTLRLKNAPANAAYRIVNSVGQVVRSIPMGSMVEVNGIGVGNLAPGLYFVQVIGADNKVQTLKFLKN